MQRRFVLLAAVLTTGCGRFSFEPSGDAGATSGSWCARTAHTFCDDFDRTTPVDEPWDVVMRTGGALAFAEDVASSPPRSLRVDVSFPGPDLVYMSKFVPAPTRHVRVIADLALDRSDQNGEVDMLTLQWRTPTPPCTLLGFVIVRDDMMQEVKLQETYIDCGDFVYTPVAFPAGFRHVELEVTLGSPGRVALAIDGTTAIDHPTLPDIAASGLELKVGASFVGALTGPWQLHYDNVAIDVE